MNCEQFITYLSDYIDNDLDDDLTAEAQAHLATCQNCSIMLDTTQKTILLYRNQQVLTIPAENRARLFQQLQASFINNSPERL